MSTLLHPKGSEPSEVYWRRRVVVIAVAVVLVLVVAWIAWPKGTGAAVPDPQQSAPVPPSAPVTPSTTGSPPPSSSSPSSSPSPTGPVACDPAGSNLGVAGYQKVKQGGTQTFKVSIKNTAAPCVLQLSGSNFTFTVKSGSDQIWSTADCDKWLPTVKDVKLKQGQTYQFDLTWGLVRSKPGCKTTKDLVKPGTYVGTATFGAGVISDRQVFVVTKAS
jgi:hypothetical protein